MPAQQGSTEKEPVQKEPAADSKNSGKEASSKKPAAESTTKSSPGATAKSSADTAKPAADTAKPAAEPSTKAGPEAAAKADPEATEEPAAKAESPAKASTEPAKASAEPAPKPAAEQEAPKSSAESASEPAAAKPAPEPTAKPEPAAKPASEPVAKPRPTAAKSTTKRTIGINLSAATKFTTLVAVEWRDDGAWVTEATVDLEDDELIGYLVSGDRTGIYAPFGWPVAMVEALASYTNSDQWQRASRKQFRYRHTEGFVHDLVQAEADEELWPSSVSCDRLALQARRMAQLREQLFAETGTRFDRAGGDHILEVYPPGAFAIWGLALGSTNGNGNGKPVDPTGEAEGDVLTRIEAKAPWLHWKDGKRSVCQKNENTLEALLAALVARAAELNLTIGPEDQDLDLARREGWMHLPAKDSLPALINHA